MSTKKLAERFGFEPNTLTGTIDLAGRDGAPSRLHVPNLYIPIVAESLRFELNALVKAPSVFETATIHPLACAFH